MIESVAIETGAATSFRDSLINKITVISAVTMLLAYGCVHLRAFNVGWSQRDTIQTLLMAGILVIAFLRKRIQLQHKALLLATLYTLGGISGVGSLGMLGGTIFIFPAVAVVMAILYSLKRTAAYICLSLLFLSFMAFLFCSGRVPLSVDANALLVNPFHWLVYLTCIGFLFMVTTVTVYTYRRATESMLDKIGEQRDELVSVNKELGRKNHELQHAMDEIKILSGLLPICSSCKKIRDDRGYWNQMEVYIQDRSEAQFTHGICPECARDYYPELFDEEGNLIPS